MLFIPSYTFGASDCANVCPCAPSDAPNACDANGWCMDHSAITRDALEIKDNVLKATFTVTYRTPDCSFQGNATPYDSDDVNFYLTAKPQANQLGTYKKNRNLDGTPIEPAPYETYLGLNVVLKGPIKLVYNRSKSSIEQKVFTTPPEGISLADAKPTPAGSAQYVDLVLRLGGFATARGEFVVSLPPSQPKCAPGQTRVEVVDESGFQERSEKPMRPGLTSGLEGGIQYIQAVTGGITPKPAYPIVEFFGLSSAQFELIRWTPPGESKPANLTYDTPINVAAGGIRFPHNGCFGNEYVTISPKSFVEKPEWDQSKNGILSASATLKESNVAIAPWTSYNEHSYTIKLPLKINGITNTDTILVALKTFKPDPDPDPDPLPTPPPADPPDCGFKLHLEGGVIDNIGEYYGKSDACYQAGTPNIRVKPDNFDSVPADRRGMTPGSFVGIPSAKWNDALTVFTFTMPNRDFSICMVTQPGKRYTEAFDKLCPTTNSKDENYPSEDVLMINVSVDSCSFPPRPLPGQSDEGRRGAFLCGMVWDDGLSSDPQPHPIWVNRDPDLYRDKLADFNYGGSVYGDCSWFTFEQFFVATGAGPYEYDFKWTNTEWVFNDWGWFWIEKGEWKKDELPRPDDFQVSGSLWCHDGSYSGYAALRPYTDWLNTLAAKAPSVQTVNNTSVKKAATNYASASGLASQGSTLFYSGTPVEPEIPALMASASMQSKTLKSSSMKAASSNGCRKITVYFDSDITWVDSSSDLKVHMPPLNSLTEPKLFFALNSFAWQAEQSQSFSNNTLSACINDAGYYQVFAKPTVTQQSSPQNLTLGEIYVYPNPVKSGDATLHIEIQGMGSLTVDVYDVSGDVVYTPPTIPPSTTVNGKPTYEIPLPTKKFSPGIYNGIVHAENNGKKYSKNFKFTVIK